MTEVNTQLLAQAISEISNALMNNYLHALMNVDLDQVDELAGSELLIKALVPAMEANKALLETVQATYGFSGPEWDAAMAKWKDSISSQAAALIDESQPPNRRLQAWIDDANEAIEKDLKIKGLEGAIEKLTGAVSHIQDVKSLFNAVHDHDAAPLAGMLVGAAAGAIAEGALAGLAVAIGIEAFPVIIVGAIVAVAIKAGTEFGTSLLNEMLGISDGEYDLITINRLLGNSGVSKLPSIDFAMRLGGENADVLVGDDHVKNILHGAGGNDIVTGADEDDRLLGGDGNDIIEGLSGDDALIGGTGDDRLTGGAGSDSLDGGVGNDTYAFSTADFATRSDDTIVDADGVGTVTFNGTAIGFNVAMDGVISRVGSQGYYWETSDGLFSIYVGQPNAQDQRDLIIYYLENSSRIVVKNWKNGDLGIVLRDYNEPGTSENPQFYTNDADLAGPVAADGLLLTTAGRDTIAAGDGNDGIDAGAGDDDVDGGTGSDMIIGGTGNDKLFGYDGDDFIIDAAITVDWRPFTDDEMDQILARGDLVTYGKGWFVTRNADNGMTWWVGSTNQGWAALDPSIASGGDDYIRGGAGNDQLLAGEGRDRVFGDEGDDNIDGGADDDVLSGGTGDDVIYGDRFLDKFDYAISANANVWGNDILSGDEGNDKLVGMGGNDTLTGGTGDDALYGDDPLSGGLGDGNDVLDGGEGNDFLEGDGGNDELTGGVGNDILWGDNQVLAGALHGDDKLDGGAGEDDMTGGGGNDILVGGDDNDTMRGDDLLGALGGQFHGNDALDGGDGDDLMEGGGGSDYMLGGAGNDTMWGDVSGGGLDAADEGRDILNGGAGDDHLVGGGNADSLAGGDGDDVIEGDGLTSIVAGSHHGDDSIDGGAGNDTIAGDGGNDAILGGAGNDTLYGDRAQLAGEFHGNDRIDGGDGDDIIFGNGGNDTLLGGAGNDQLIGDDDDVAGEIQGNDTLDGGDGDDQLYGRGGDDILIGGKGLDAYDGGAGNDTFVFRTGDAKGVVDESTMTITYEGIDDAEGSNIIQLDVASDDPSVSLTRISSNNGDLFLKFGDGEGVIIYGGMREDGFSIRFSDGVTMSIDALGSRSLVGTSGNDILIGFNGDDTVDGGDGRDQIVGVGGNDVLYGGAGDDSLSGQDGDDRLFGGDGDDSIDGGNGNDTLSGGLSVDHLWGGAGDDRYLYANGDGEDTITDLDGLNTIVLSGFTRDQVYMQSNGSDLVIRFLGAGGLIHLVNYFDRWNDGAAVAGLAIDFGDGVVVNYSSEDLENAVLQGTSGNDNITGNDKNNTIAGGLGDDTIWARGGNDVLDGGDGRDSLNGEAGDDVLRGGRDNDTLAGGVGSDTYYYNLGDGNDVMVERGKVGDKDVLMFGTGIRPQDVSVSYINGVLVLSIGGSTVSLSGLFDKPFGDDDYQFEEIRFTDGTVWNSRDLAASLLNGNDADNIINGYETNDTLLGKGGNDRLVAGGGNDVIVGGKGNDLLFGGAGDDTYIYDVGDGIDIIDASTPFGTPGLDVISLGAGITTGNITLYRVASPIDGFNDGDDLVIVVDGYQGQMVVRHHFQSNGYFNISSLKFADGTVWDMAAMASHVVNLAGSADQLIGTTGNDTFVVDNARDTIEATQGGIDTVVTAMDNYVLANDVANLTLNGPGNVTATGNNLNNVITGNDGDNVLSGGYGYNVPNIDTLIGGKGNDTYKVDWEDPYYIQTEGWFNDIVIEGVNGGIDTILANSFSARLPDNVEILIDVYGMNGYNHLIYNYVGRSLIGNALDNTIVAGGYIMGWGFTIDGGEGADQMYGSTESDRYYVDNVGDRVYESGDSLKNDIVYSSVSFTLPAGVEDMSMTGAAATTGIGNDRDNHLWGTEGTGANVLIGGKGNDTYTIGAGDSIVELDGEGIDTVYVQTGAAVIDMATFGSVENLILYDYIPATEAPDLQTIVGTAANNAITGSSGDNVLIGGAGDDIITDNYSAYLSYDVDTLLGGDGNDVLTSTSGWDTLDGGAGDDQLLGGVGNTTFVFGAGYGHDTIVSDRDTSLFSSFTDRILFTAGTLPSDLIVSRQGADLIVTLVGDGGSMTVGGFFQNATANDLSGVIEHFEFADGSFLTGSDIVSLMSHGGASAPSAGSDAVLGTGASETIDALGGDDVVWGLGGDDVLRGGAGSDTLSGGDGNDTLDGGTGNDVLVGGSGSDTYAFGRGYGNDAIQEEPNVEGAVDKVLMNADVAPDDVVVRFVDGAVVLSIVGTTDSLRLPNEVSQTGWVGVEEVRFADGTVWNAAKLLELAITFRGTAGDDVLFGDYTGANLYGLGGNDLLYGSNGTSLLVGGAGDDIYSLSGYSALQTIDNTGGGYDGIVYDADSEVAFSSLSFSKVGNDLKILVDKGNSETVLVKDHFLAGDQSLDYLRVGDDTTITGADINEIVAGGAVAQTYNNLYAGTSAGEQIQGSTKRDWINGLGGNDTLYGMAGNDTVRGGDGDDILWGGTGSGTSSGTDYLYGGNGNDTLYGEDGNDMLYGGAGDDKYVYGGGTDKIDNTGGGYDGVVFGNGITASRLSFQKSGNDLIIKVDGSSTNVMRVVNHYLGGDYAIDYVQPASGPIIPATSFPKAKVAATQDSLVASDPSLGVDQLVDAMARFSGGGSAGAFDTHDGLPDFGATTVVSDLGHRFQAAPPSM